MTKAASVAKKSTTVRSFRRLVFGSVRLAFAVLERVAPTLGGWWAERLWFTPQSSGRRGTVVPSAQGHRFEVYVHGRRMVGENWGAGPVVYLLHGWGGHRGQLGAFVDPLVAAGYRVVSVDATSHGESAHGDAGPGRSTILEFTDVLDAVCVAKGPAHAVIAHSIGCMATAVAVRNRLRVRRLVFIAPMGDIRPYTKEFSRRAGFGERVRANMVRRIEHRVALPLSHFEVASIAKEVDTPPLLLVHDRTDNETNWADSRAIADAWPDARLHSTNDLGHNRILQDPDVVAEIVSFVVDTDAAESPSAGAAEGLRQLASPRTFTPERDVLSGRR
ncbi:alpha/beta hydrolase [Solihabitans fulvus]|uniref:Alpha/beta hydrolase n=1 Tax=Solihabitans fulvus TaxID=1892852 RepID=A0A5B2WJ68_9PSEU|nr:alpha/beta hydrolase [Solihabitans fulvus]KAA2250958.1 alpha/beta hydrolase [Solihabitans fulvus]